MAPRPPRSPQALSCQAFTSRRRAPSSGITTPRTSSRTSSSSSSTAPCRPRHSAGSASIHPSTTPSRPPPSVLRLDASPTPAQGLAGALPLVPRGLRRLRHPHPSPPCDDPVCVPSRDPPLRLLALQHHDRGAHPQRRPAGRARHGLNLHALRWYDNHSARDLIVASALAGAAVLTKPNGWALIGGLLVLALVRALSRRSPTTNASPSVPPGESLA